MPFDKAHALTVMVYCNEWKSLSFEIGGFSDSLAPSLDQPSKQQQGWKFCLLCHKPGGELCVNVNWLLMGLLMLVNEQTNA